jgi:phospholipid transport system substrate-binding protein
MMTTPRGAHELPQQIRSERSRLRAPNDLNAALTAKAGVNSSDPAFPLNLPPPKGTPAVPVPFVRFVLFACSILFLAPTIGLAATSGSASQAVESLHETLTLAMKEADSLGYTGRFDKIAPAVKNSIDQEFMATKSIGRHWKKLSEDEQKRWLKTFADLTVANYAGRFKGYSGERFTLDGEEDAPHDTKLVKTTLVLPNDDDITLNYRLHQTESGWKIIDIYMNGTVSELSLRRSEYSSKVKREGFETLMAAVEKKLADFAEGTVDDTANRISSSAPARP